MAGNGLDLGGGGVVVVVPILGSSVILVSQFRPPMDSHVLEFPAGTAEEGESLEMAARRELLEETGYEAGALERLLEGASIPPSSSEVVTVCAAYGLVKKAGAGGGTGDEHIKTVVVSLSDGESLLDGTYFVDVKVGMLLALYGLSDRFG